MGFYTPILTGSLTAMGLEAAHLGIQVFGGRGYIGEHGMEKIARLLPRADGHYSTALAPTSAVMQMPQGLFQIA